MALGDEERVGPSAHVPPSIRRHGLLAPPHGGWRSASPASQRGRRFPVWSSRVMSSYSRHTPSLQRWWSSPRSHRSAGSASHAPPPFGTLALPGVLSNLCLPTEDSPGRSCGAGRLPAALAWARGSTGAALGRWRPPGGGRCVMLDDRGVNEGECGVGVNGAHSRRAPCGCAVGRRFYPPPHT